MTGATTAPQTRRKRSEPKVGPLLAGKIDTVESEPVLKQLHDGIPVSLLIKDENGYTFDGKQLEGFQCLHEEEQLRVVGSIAVLPSAVKVFLGDTFDELPQGGVILWCHDEAAKSFSVVAAEPIKRRPGQYTAGMFEFSVDELQVARILMAIDDARIHADHLAYTEEAENYRDVHSNGR
jgi:hypothetical protein